MSLSFTIHGSMRSTTRAVQLIVHDPLSRKRIVLLFISSFLPMLMGDVGTIPARALTSLGATVKHRPIPEMNKPLQYG
jgi:hypothetical protein